MMSAQPASVDDIDLTIEPNHQKYPYCILWSPLPPITWLFPFIGHTGIATSKGVIYDFAGPYTIGKQYMAFGPPTRYIQLDPSLCRDVDWDAAVSQGCEIYSQRMHNICCDNCHSHVAKCLNIMGYGNKRNYGMVDLAAWFFFQGRFVSFCSFLSTFLPFMLIVTGIVLVSVYA
jgi:transmembrane protein 222